MSKGTKIILAILVVVIIAGLIISFTSSPNKEGTPTSNETSATTTATVKEKPAVIGITGLGLSEQADTKSSSIQADMSVVDSEIGRFGADITDINQALTVE